MKSRIERGNKFLSKIALSSSLGRGGGDNVKRARGVSQERRSSRRIATSAARRKGTRSPHGKESRVTLARGKG